jgi:FAD/FMN-containing dehydrogenase
MECITRSRQASFLAVLKESGASTPGLLSYLYPGYTLALDFPYRGEKTHALFKQLDEIVLDHQGRLYLAKDALTSAETFQQMYPRLSEFQAVKARVDPENRFLSSQARRLGIAGNVTSPQAELTACSMSYNHQEMGQ